MVNNRNRSTRSAFWLLAAFAVFLLSACQSDNSARPPDITRVSDAELHGIMTDHIGALLSQIEVLMYDQHRTEPELDQVRRVKAIQIADAAARLQQAAQMILVIQPRLALTENEAVRFGTLAEQLGARGAELEELALRNRFESLRIAVDSTLNTCNECHRLYRGI